MRRRCNDPVCPANKILLSNGKSFKSNGKQPKASHPEIPATNSRVTRSRHKGSKVSAKPRRKSKERNKKSKPSYSHARTCKNKKCQASKPTVECSTSTCPPQKIRVKSRESVKSTTPRQVFHVPQKPQTQICNCHDYNKEERHGRKSRRSCCGRSKSSRRSKETNKKKERRKSRCRRKKSAGRESDRKNKLLTALCICVRSPSSRDLGSRKRTTPCAMLSKHAECCCVIKNNGSNGMREILRGNKKKHVNLNGGTLANRPHSERKESSKCTCVGSSMIPKAPQETESLHCAFAKRLSCMRERIERFNNSAISFFRSEPVCGHQCCPCPVHHASSNPSSHKRNRHISGSILNNTKND